MQSRLLRSFIAIEVPPDVQTVIAASVSDLQKALPKPLVRWVAAKNIHLTLKFLGDVSPANLDQLAEALRSDAAGQTGFDLPVGGIGVYPSERRARVIWIGVEAPAGLFTLQREVESRAYRADRSCSDASCRGAQAPWASSDRKASSRRRATSF